MVRMAADKVFDSNVSCFISAFNTWFWAGFTWLHTSTFSSGKLRVGDFHFQTGDWRNVLVGVDDLF